jgi:protein TonB
MDTPMNTVRKSFFLSLMFHSLMGSLAFFVLIQMRTPPPILKISVKHMMLISRADSKSIPKQPKISETSPAITPPQPIIPAKAINAQPITSSVQITPSTAATQTPIVSTPPALQHSIQTAPVADVAPPPRVKGNTASELQSFKASLKTKIKQNLRNPPTAQRRGMQGEVAIRFTVFGDGSLRDISILQGEEIFHTAARVAVASSSGIDVPKSLTELLPMEMDLTLEFN